MVDKEEKDELVDEEEKVGLDAAAERPVLGSYRWGGKKYLLRPTDDVEEVMDKEEKDEEEKDEEEVVDDVVTLVSLLNSAQS